MVIGIVGHTLGESDPTKTCKLDKQKPATCANRRSLHSIILCNFSEVGVKPVYVTDESCGLFSDRIANACSMNKRVQITLSSIYFKLPQMSPNTSSLLVCVLLADVDDPKRPTLAPAGFPADPPQISLPEPSRDGC